MHDYHVRLPLVTAMLSLVLGLINSISFVWCVQELMAPHKRSSNDSNNNTNIAEFIRTFQQMANAMQA